MMTEVAVSTNGKEEQLMKFCIQCYNFLRPRLNKDSVSAFNSKVGTEPGSRNDPCSKHKTLNLNYNSLSGTQ